MVIVMTGAGTENANVALARLDATLERAGELEPPRIAYSAGSISFDRKVHRSILE